jgi:type IV pilus assembly protein PilM
MISFLRRPKTTVGLDIGSGFVKAVVVNHAGAEPELSRISYLPLVADAIVEGEIMDPTLVADTIRAVLSGLGTPVKQVVTAVGGRDVIVKKIQMDRMREEDAREVIRWEAEQYVPFDMANVQLDFQILDPDAEGLQMDVLLVAAKRELVDQRMLLLEEVGVGASVVDVDAFAIHNAFEYNYPDAARGVVALVNVGHEISNILIQQDGVPAVTREVAYGSRHIREELRRMHGLSQDEAESIIQGNSGRGEEFAPLLTERSEELAMGIERALAFLSVDSSLGRGLAAVYLSGGGARIPWLAETISSRARARIEIANPLQRLRISPEATAQFPADDIAPMLMLPIGLALRTAA